MKIKLYFFRRLDTGKIEYSQFEHKGEIETWGIPIGSKTIEVEPPEIDEKHPTSFAINQLQEEQRQIKATAQARCSKVGEEIQRLLAIYAPKGES